MLNNHVFGNISQMEQNFQFEYLMRLPEQNSICKVNRIKLSLWINPVYVGMLLTFECLTEFQFITKFYYDAG